MWVETDQRTHWEGQIRRRHKALQEESLQSALFGGGFGGAFNPEKLLNDFDSQAEKLFKARGSSPSINVICAGLKDIAKVIKEKTVRPDDYEQRRQDWQAAHSKSETLAAEVTELRVRHARTEKLVKALPLWVERRAHRDVVEVVVVQPGACACRPHPAAHRPERAEGQERPVRERSAQHRRRGEEVELLQRSRHPIAGWVVERGQVAAQGLRLFVCEGQPAWFHDVDERVIEQLLVRQLENFAVGVHLD